MRDNFNITFLPRLEIYWKNTPGQFRIDDYMLFDIVDMIRSIIVMEHNSYCFDSLRDCYGGLLDSLAQIDFFDFADIIVAAFTSHNVSQQ